MARDRIHDLLFLTLFFFLTLFAVSDSNEYRNDPK